MDAQSFAPIHPDSIIVPVTREELKTILVALTEYHMGPNYRVLENEYIALSPSTLDWVVLHLIQQGAPMPKAFGEHNIRGLADRVKANSAYSPMPPQTSFVKAAYVEVATRLDGNPNTETASLEFDAWLRIQRGEGA